MRAPALWSGLTVIALILSGIGCGDLSKKNVELMKRRNAKVVVKDGEKEIMEVNVQYIGKKPMGTPKKPLPQGWEEKRTDFYRISFQNRSMSSITFLREEYSIAKGELETPKQKSQDEIAEELGLAVLSPGLKVVFSNAYVFGNGEENTLIKKYFFESEGKSYEVEVPLLFVR